MKSQNLPLPSFHHFAVLLLLFFSLSCEARKPKKAAADDGKKQSAKSESPKTDDSKFGSGDRLGSKFGGESSEIGDDDTRPDLSTQNTPIPTSPPPYQNGQNAGQQQLPNTPPQQSGNGTPPLSSKGPNSIEVQISKSQTAGNFSIAVIDQSQRIDLNSPMQISTQLINSEGAGYSPEVSVVIPLKNGGRCHAQFAELNFGIIPKFQSECR